MARAAKRRRNDSSDSEASSSSDIIPRGSRALLMASAERRGGTARREERDEALQRLDALARAAPSAAAPATAVPPAAAIAKAPPAGSAPAAASVAPPAIPSIPPVATVPLPAAIMAPAPTTSVPPSGRPSGDAVLLPLISGSGDTYTISPASRVATPFARALAEQFGMNPSKIFPRTNTDAIFSADLRATSVGLFSSILYHFVYTPTAAHPLHELTVGSVPRATHPFYPGVTTSRFIDGLTANINRARSRAGMKGPQEFSTKLVELGDIFAAFHALAYLLSCQVAVQPPPSSGSHWDYPERILKDQLMLMVPIFSAMRSYDRLMWLLVRPIIDAYGALTESESKRLKIIYKSDFLEVFLTR